MLVCKDEIARAQAVAGSLAAVAAMAAVGVGAAAAWAAAAAAWAAAPSMMAHAASGKRVIVPRFWRATHRSIRHK